MTKNDINQKPVTTVRHTIADVENSFIGIVGAIFTGFIGLVLFKMSVVASIGDFLLTVMCVVEVLRGITSVKNKSLIEKNNGSQNLEAQQMFKVNDEKIKKYNKIKTICMILGIVLIIVGLLFFSKLR